MSETKSSRLPIWLVGSLVVNALLVGLLIGGGLANRKHPHMRQHGGEYALARGIDQAIPEAERQAVRQAFRRAYAGSREQRLELHRARAELGDVLAAEPYDRDAVTAAFARVRLADGQTKIQLHEELVSVLEGLSVEQRRAILHDLDRRGLRRRHRRDRGPPPPPE